MIQSLLGAFVDAAADHKLSAVSNSCQWRHQTKQLQPGFLHLRPRWNDSESGGKGWKTSPDSLDTSDPN